MTEADSTAIRQRHPSGTRRDEAGAADGGAADWGAADWGAADWGIVGLYAVVAVAMALHFAGYLPYAIAAVRYPFGLDYGEGIVWQQALLIPGPLMYGDITRYPFIVFHYPPLYHLLVHAASALGLDGLVAGRLISVSCTLAIGVLAGGVTFAASVARSGRAASLAGALIAGLGVFCFWPVVAWSPMLRVDMLAIAFSFLGVWCVIRAASRPGLIYVAVLAFVLAVWTKQSCIAAPLAALPLAFIAAPRRTLQACAIGFLLSVAALLVMVWATDGGFLRHIVLYNLNRFSVAAAARRMFLQSWHAGFFAVAIVAVIVEWSRLAASHAWNSLSDVRKAVAFDGSVRAMAIVTLYFVTTTVETVATSGKSGAALNYTIEWMCVWSVLIGILVASNVARAVASPAPARRGARRMFPRLLALLLPMILALQVLILPATRDFGQFDQAAKQQLGLLQTRVRDAERPVLSDDMVLLLKAGKQVPWEPAIFAELASTGQWNEQRITDMIEARAFAFIVTSGLPGERFDGARFTPAVAHAIEAAYPATQAFPGRLLHLPPQPPASAVSQ